jgi:transposase
MIPSGVRIFVCTEPQDMRRSFDGLSLAAREKLGEDPQSGALFVFTNKRGNRLKVLWFDRNGYCILYKRLHRARFRLPDASEGGRPVTSCPIRSNASRPWCSSDVQRRWSSRG